jgi:Flp pilus assembly protein TadD
MQTNYSIFAESSRTARIMQILKTFSRRGTAPLLAAGVVLMLATARLPAQEESRQAEQAQKRIERLIEQLGHQDYLVRERAQAELAELSFEAFDALNAATTHEDLEIAARARRLLRLMRVQWTTESDPPEVKKLLAGYELLSPKDKSSKISSLARLADEKGIPALCRLVRYEKAPVLSKQAAMALLGSQPSGEPPTKELARLLREGVGSSRRPAAIWLITWLRFGDAAEAAVTDWTKLVEQEYLLLRQASTQTDANIVAKLVRLQVQWFKKLDRKDQTLAAMHRLVDLETGNAQTMAELLSWLLEQQAWDSVDKLATRFPAQFAQNPNLLLLLYTTAQAQAEKGNNDRAEQTAQRALKLNPGNSSQRLFKHYIVARALWRREMLEWAQREYRHIIETGAANSDVVTASHTLLGEMLHDQGDEIEAAKVLEGLVNAARKQPNLPSTLRAGLPGIRSRMDYFLACHHESRQDRAKQREHLDKALAADPTDADVLITRYRLPDQTAEYREETLKLIGQAAAKFRQRITHGPDDSTAYNQFAWLVANTQGDLDAALEFSKRSIQLSPGSGGYHDTLAHVYFARGDYENAVKTQTRAAQMEPHLKIIAKQLEVFRKKWEETKDANGNRE